MGEELSLECYKLLGRSGLRVSPLALGTMTFGLNWGWGTDQDEARRIFNAYVQRGGNFIDTANNYTDGSSEKFIGEFAAGMRDRLIISTKYTIPTRSNDPNSGGNHRKSMVRSIETSLTRLATDYVDLLYLHAWDSTTPVEEILRAMDDLVRSGKVLYIGISNTPAWRVAMMQVMAEIRGWSALTALQVQYSLIERSVERELIPMARELGLGIVPWSPLGGGLLAGKYTDADLKSADPPALSDGTRRTFMISNKLISDRGLGIAEVSKSLAAEIGRSPCQVALAWILSNPSVTSVIIGARTLKQLEDNIGVFDVKLTEAQLGRLETVSAIELGYPHDYLASIMAGSLMKSTMNFVRS